jgi:hypothetical protein
MQVMDLMNFILLLDTKGNVIKNFFKKKKFNWKIHLINTGKKYYDGW